MQYLAKINVPVSAIIMVVLLTGCATYEPKPLSPSQTALAFEARTLDNPGLKKFMEKNFHNEITSWPPKLWDFTMLTLAAFYYHPDLDVARAKWGIAEAGVIAVGGIPNPSVGFTPQYNVDSSIGVSPWTLGFTFDIPVETANKRGYRVAQAKYLSEAARLNIATVVWQVRSRLRRGIIELYMANQVKVMMQKQIAVQEEIVRLMEQRLVYGEIAQPEVTQAHISLEQMQLSLREAQKQNAEARVQLADALGLPVSAIDGFDISFDFLKQFPSDLLLQNVRRWALLNRPDILSALAEYAASQSALQLEIARQYPDIHIGPSYSWDVGDNKWSLGFSITLPVFNRNEGPIAEAESRRKEAAASFIVLQSRIIGEIDRALAGYSAALQKLETADSLLSVEGKQLQSIQAMVNIGEADRLALLSAQLELTTSELSSIDTLVKVQQSLGLLEDAVQRPLNSGESFSIIPETNPRAKEENKK